MYKRIKECFKEPLSGNILGISGIKNFYPIIDMKNAEIIDVQYPIVDIQNLPFKNNTFDFVLSDQVLEHIQNPHQAVAESYRVLKKDGIAIHTTCFINHVHRVPIDFWRFSSDALRYICKDCGFTQIIQCEGWGNRIAILFCFISDKLRFINIPKTKWSIRHLIATLNEERYPIVTWVVAKK